jgi:hypothetical protein
MKSCQIFASPEDMRELLGATCTRCVIHDAAKE